MKNYLYTLLFSILIISCKSKTVQTEQDSITADTLTSLSKANQSLINQFKPIIQGAWVKADYIDKVIKTKSPAASMDMVGGLTVMYIDTDSIRADSMKIGAGWNNHEGGDLTLKFKQGKKPGSILLGDFDLSYSITRGDTVLMITEFNKELNKTFTTRYIKALRKQATPNLAFGMEYLMNKGLVAGKYFATDSLGNQSKVAFNADGQVTGLSNFKKYFIENDLTFEPMSNLDGIIFDIYSKNQISYNFKILGDTLKLYDSYPNADSTKLILGRLKYKLVRTK